jgi:hypothetical protein
MRRFYPYVGGLASVVLALSTLAQPVPKLNSISRDSLQRGQSVRLSISGENLVEPKEILISGAPGVSAKLVPPPESNLAVESSLGGITSVTRPDGKSVAVEVSIEPHAALTERELRVATGAGVSNPLSFGVSHLSEVTSGGKTKRDEAEVLALPAAISGVLRKAAESHFFRFSAKKGEHVIFDLYAARDGSSLDSSLAVLDLSGKELARNEDASGLDSVIDFTAPEDGDYLVELRDFRYQGGDNYKYRLIAGVSPYVASAFPFGGQRGQTVEVQLKGVNLEGHSKLLLQLDQDAPAGRQEIRASTPLGLSNPFPFDVSDLPDRAETEPNSALDQADAITIPVAINGRIGGKKDYDAFRFEAAKNQRVIFEVSAFRHASRLDALLTLTDDRGNVLQRNDDSSAVDARIDYTFKNAGAHFIILEDLLGRGGEDFGYRLAVSLPEPNFSVSVSPDAARLRRGGHLPIRCEVSRMNGFAGAVKIVCEDLPSGVYAEPLILSPNGPVVGVLMLTAGAEAPLGSFPVKFTATSLLQTGSLRRDAQALSGDKPVKQAFLSVLAAAPFAVAAATMMADVEQNQSGSIEVLVERRNGFNGEIKIMPETYSGVREGIGKSFDFQPLVLQAGMNSGTLTLRAKTDAELGARPLVLKAEAQSDGQTVADYSRPLPLATDQIPFVLSLSLKKLLVTALPENTGSAASEAVFAVKVARRMGFTGELALTLEGVPEGVQATVANVAENAAEAAIKLVASEKAATGKEYSLTITGVGTHKDRIYRFKSPPISLTINAPEKDAEAKVAATK